MARDELNPLTKWIVGAIVVLTLLVLAYQRVHRSDRVEAELRPNELPEPAPAGKLDVSPQVEAVTKGHSVFLPGKPKGKK